MIGQVVYQAMQRWFKLTNLSKKNVMKKLLNSLHSFLGSTISGVDIEILLSIPISDFLFLN